MLSMFRRGKNERTQAITQANPSEMDTSTDTHQDSDFDRFMRRPSREPSEYERRGSGLARDWDEGFNRQAIKDQVSKTVQRARSLTPGGRRLLLIIHRLLEQNDFEPLTRPAIASALQHPKLHRYDLKLMDVLITAGFITARRYSLSDAGNLRGSEYRYSMDIDTAWMLHHARKK